MQTIYTHKCNFGLKGSAGCVLNPLVVVVVANTNSPVDIAAEDAAAEDEAGTVAPDTGDTRVDCMLVKEDTAKQ